LVPAKALPTGVILFESIIAQLLHLSTAPMSFSGSQPNQPISHEQVSVKYIQKNIFSSCNKQASKHLAVIIVMSFSERKDDRGKKQFQWKQSFVDCRLAIPKTKQDVGSNVTPHFGSHVHKELLFSKQSGTPHTSHQLY
jgi:hypothetical protein